jgi:hypothetical protein
LLWLFLGKTGKRRKRREGCAGLWRINGLLRFGKEWLVKLMQFSNSISCFKGIWMREKMANLLTAKTRKARILRIII